MRLRKIRQSRLRLDVHAPRDHGAKLPDPLRLPVLEAVLVLVEDLLDGLHRHVANVVSCCTTRWINSCKKMERPELGKKNPKNTQKNGTCAPSCLPSKLLEHPVLHGQSWETSVFLNFFNNKKWFFAFFIKLIWLGVGFLNMTGAEIYRLLTW